MVLGIALSWFDHYVTLPEVLWTIFGSVGFWFAFKNLQESISDLGAIPVDEPHILERALALAHMRTEAFRLLIHMCSIGIGFAAMLTPPATIANPITPLAVIVTFGLFLINVVTVLQSVLDRNLRKELTEEIEREVGNGNGNGLSQEAAKGQA